MTQERRDVPGTRQSAPITSGSQASNQQSNNPLEAIASETGLGALFGNAQHGVGLLPVCSVLFRSLRMKPS